MRKSGKKKKQMVKSIRKRKIVSDFMRGAYSNQAELAVRYGVTEATISIYLKEAFEERKKRDAVWMDKQFMLMEERLLDIFAQNETSYQLSKQPAREISTKYVRVKCPACKGTGWEDGDEDSEEWCDNCGGDGKITEEQVSEKITGQAGDPAFLSNKLAVIKEWNKLHGNYPRKPKEEHQHLHLHEGTMDLSQVPNNVLLQALDVIDILKAGAEGKVIDAEVVDNKGKGD